MFFSVYAQASLLIQAKALMKLPQWVLLFPIGLLAIIGSVEF